MKVMLLLPLDIRVAPLSSILSSALAPKCLFDITPASEWTWTMIGENPRESVAMKLPRIQDRVRPCEGSADVAEFTSMGRLFAPPPSGG